MFAIIFIFSIFLFIIIYIHFLKPYFKNKRRNKIKNQPIPKEWFDILQKNIPIFEKLPQYLKKDYLGWIQVFLDEVYFEGCQGLELTLEMKVTIAAQACILILNKNIRFYPKLISILVYPSTYFDPNDDDNVGRLGESWQAGIVVLAWDAVKHGAYNIKDGKNVVFHEFAHQLDQEDGYSDGAPILKNRSSYSSWAKILGKEYEKLQNKKKKCQRSVIYKYGATNPAEFFAVATETFFEKPKQLIKKHPELYNELKDYFNLDPLTWN